LAGDGMIRFTKDRSFFTSAAAAQEHLIQQRFGHRIRTTPPARNDPHRHVGIARQPGLHDGNRKFEWAHAAGALNRARTNRLRTRGSGLIVTQHFPVHGNTSGGSGILQVYHLDGVGFKRASRFQFTGQC
jgi:hypothetical protein